MRKTLKKTGSMKESFSEIERLDKLYLKTFNKGCKSNFFAYSAGHPKLSPEFGITIEYAENDKKELEFFELNK